MKYYVLLPATKRDCEWNDCGYKTIFRILVCNDGRGSKNSDLNLLKKGVVYFNIYNVCELHMPNAADHCQVTIRFFLKLMKKTENNHHARYDNYITPSYVRDLLLKEENIEQETKQ